MAQSSTMFAFTVVVSFAIAATDALAQEVSVAVPSSSHDRDPSARLHMLADGAAASDRDIVGLLPSSRGKRFIGLGEATHGTHEIFALKARIARLLVARGGAKAIALEASFGSTLPASDYVAGDGEGDLAAAMASLKIPTYQTEEIAGFLEQLRTFNQGRPPSARAQLFGYDVQDPRGEVRAVVGFLARLGLEPAGDPAVSEFAAGRGPVQTIPPASVPALRATIEAFRGRYVANALTIRRRSSDGAYERYLHCLDVALQALSLFDAPSQKAAYYKRDRLGAENVEWIERVARGPVIIWAHNAHIAKDNEEPEFVTLGETLAQRYGRNYFAMGTSFFDGSVRALSGGKLVPNILPKPPAASFENFLLSAGGGRSFVVLFDQVRQSKAWRDKLDALTTLRAIGVAYQPDEEGRTYRPTVPAQMYDALAFVPHSTPSRPLQRPD